MEIGTRTALLLALRSGPGYGLALARRISATTGGVVPLRLGGVSQALRALEEDRLVRSWPRPRPTAGRPRRYYELTQSGQAHAERSAQALSSLLESAPLGTKPLDHASMAERVRQSGKLSAAALRVRAAGAAAGL